MSALDWPENSEILYSALNVKGMVKIAERHGLQPVPVDLELDSMGPSLEALERAITPQSRAIVVAHLFGTRLDGLWMHVGTPAAIDLAEASIADSAA